MTIKLDTENPLLANMDIEKVESKLQKEIMGKKRE